jgi:toxin ParE1/3/4
VSRPRSGKPLVRRTRADADVIEAIDHLLAESADAALRFIAALEAAYARIRRSPAIGSPRYAHELGLPGLRCRPCGRWPYLVFYVEREDRIEVWRVLHMRRDIPHRLTAGD